MNKNKSFDFVIRKKLNEMPPTPSYGAWQTFQEKWLNKEPNTTPISDQNFDKNIKTKVGSVLKSHQIQHWEKLKYRLETIETFRRKIYINKLKELIAVFLFVFTFFNVTNHFLMFPENEHIQYADNKSLSLEKIAQTKEKEEAAFDQKKGVPIKKSGLVKNNTNISNRKLVAIAEIQKFKNLPGNTKNIHSVSKHTDESYNSAFKGEVTKIDNGSTIPLIPAKVQDPYSVMATIIPMNFAASKKTNNVTRIGFYFSHVRNFILTPFDKVYSIPRFENSTSAQSYGFSVGRSFQKLEIETGFEYTNLQYSPLLIKETFGAAADIYFETSLRKIQFTIIKVPLRFKYFAFNKKGWSVYAMAGSSFNVITEAGYEIEESVVKGKPVNYNRFSDDGPRLEEKPFTTGFLDSGSLEGNYFIDLHLGIGIEKKIHSRLHVYAQPSYHSFLKSDGIGIGPNNDKVNSLHLQTGFKFTL
ncbi:MAG: hypothetical protein IPG79_08620 [Saprospiraceae bacterium]|nr:hypothetical protein [Saprospiraceae bacterium]MBK7525026.1 hypothetical protein [Saprospiraceae bacterium]MBK9044172.1 hypothetical protein [Saprospiraceae bacterium]MBP6695118.1 hypothetical protein [Saprospiraceae bacterium]